MSLSDTNQSNQKQIGIIGSGPLSLLKAHFLSLKNPDVKITLFDCASQIGGAWYSDYSPKGFEIECGCHIWSYAPKAYQFIEKDLGVKLFPVKPKPVFVGNVFNLPYSLKNTIDSYKAFVKLILKLKFKEIQQLKQKPSTHFKIFSKTNLYPKTGSPELIHALKKLIDANKNIQVKLNISIDEIDSNQNHILLKSNSENFSLDKLYITYVSSFKSLIINGRTIEIKPRQVDYVHYLIESDKPFKKNVFYWRFMTDEVVHRITDISYQTNGEENLWLVGIKDKAFHVKSEHELFEHVKNLMIKNKMIDAAHQLKLIKTHVFPTYYLNAESLQEIKNNAPLISSMHTTDLMYGLHYLLTEEMPHLMQTPK